MKPSAEKYREPEVRVGRHRAKLDEIRESLKAYEHEQNANNEVVASSSSSSTSYSTQRKQTTTTSTNGNNLMMIHQSPSTFRYEMPSPSFQRPPPPAYDETPTPRLTPVAPETHRTHLHLKVQAPRHVKNAAPPPPKSTVSIETIEDDRRNDNFHKSSSAQRLYHTSLDKKSSVISINLAQQQPHTTKVHLGDPMPTKSFMIGPRYTTVNYKDELRPDIASTSSADVYKPNLDITFSSRNIETPGKRASSPIDRSLLDSYMKNRRRIQPCKPNMFRFYMEQHVERLLQQYREREKRMRQLEKEMNAAQLPEHMRTKMLEILQQKESRYTRLRRQKMSKNHFTVISHIGLGAFGKVSLVRKKDTGKVYAMKILEKADVIMKQQAAHVKAERDILAEADSLWIVRLYFSFQDDSCLYFIMEYVPGGDMMTLLINKGIFEESLARFYIAELTCAIEYVHSVGFIHRDIKPDNILIDQHGHIKLTDFGLCTGLRWTHDRRYYGPENEHQRNDSFSLPPEVAALEKSVKVLNIRQQKRRQFAHSVVGTGNYMAPEVIARTGHTQLCDWWSMGVILYEMVFGRVPFHAENPAETQHRILNWRHYLDFSWSSHLSTKCVQMVQVLVCDVVNRCGNRGGASQIKKHPWFEGIDFDNLRNSRAEFIPVVAHDEDTSNFDTIQITDKTDRGPNVRGLNNPAFYEFTYRHFFDTDNLGCPSLRPTRRRSLRPLLENGVFDSTSSSTNDSNVNISNI
ncbi:unnamed protein product [Caenorhabditis angaria]|uniref:non-specific serine/threonine protein kinase n=1 Tax=Caenorhabditis angaria TaxID=860376 RepID=A0A9P1I6I7_9PELO|nr:unnamed protein product [Caenorhabditis angaria]